MRVNDGAAEVDMVGWMGRTALELLGQGALGYSFDPLVEDKVDPFGEAVKSFLFVPVPFLPPPLGPLTSSSARH